MTELKFIFDAFDKYEEAVSNEVDYKIKMRNGTIKDFTRILNKIKAKKVLYDIIKQFMAQTNVAQTNVAQTNVAQTNVAQTKVAQNNTNNTQKFRNARNARNARNKTNRRSTVV